MGFGLAAPDAKDGALLLRNAPGHKNKVTEQQHNRQPIRQEDGKPGCRLGQDIDFDLVGFQQREQIAVAQRIRESWW